MGITESATNKLSLVCEDPVRKSRDVHKLTLLNLGAKSWTAREAKVDATLVAPSLAELVLDAEKSYFPEPAWLELKSQGSSPAEIWIGEFPSLARAHSRRGAHLRGEQFPRTPEGLERARELCRQALRNGASLLGLAVTRGGLAVRVKAGLQHVRKLVAKEDPRYNDRNIALIPKRWWIAKNWPKGLDHGVVAKTCFEAIAWNVIPGPTSYRGHCQLETRIG